MDKAQKAKIVDWLKEATANEETVLFSSWSGLEVNDEGVLRQKMREAGGSYKVVKNTLLKLGLAARNDDGSLEDVLVGNTAITIGTDPVSIAKVWKEFIKDNKTVTIKGGLIGNKFISESDVNALADMPSKDQMLGQLAGMLMQPMTQMASVLQAPMRDLVGVLAQLEKSKS